MATSCYYWLYKVINERNRKDYCCIAASQKSSLVLEVGFHGSQMLVGCRTCECAPERVS